MRHARAPRLTAYTLLQPLGSGGFADVFLYEQHMPRRKVAIKVLTREAGVGSSRERFVAEANLMAQLSSHSSIVAIYHADTTPDGRPFLVMQYCPLPSLSERVKDGPLGVAEVLSIGVRVAGAVETAHRAGIVHRDIKPANVLTTEYGRPALADFGIAGLASAGTEEVVGVSLPWAPPEAVDGHGAGGVSGDVYSLGATLYTLLAGRSPFARPGGPNGRLDYTVRIKNDPVPPTGRGDVPPALEAVLRRSMAKDPAQRYGSALDLGEALQVVEQQLHLPMTEIEVPDTSWMSRPGPAGDDDTRTVVREVHAVDPEGGGAADDAAAATVQRPTPPRAAVGAGPEPDTGGRTEDVAARRPRTAAVVGAVAALLVAGGAVVGAGLLGGEPATEPEEVRGSAVPLPEQVGAPEDLAGTRQADGTVTFRWRPPAGEEDPRYVWQRTDPGADPAVTPTEEETLTVADAPAGVCVSVKTVATTGRTSAAAEACVE